MPKIWEDLVNRIKERNSKKGTKKYNPYAVATSALQKQGKLKKGTRVLTAKGKKYEGKK